jgi:hypothetical protein
MTHQKKQTLLSNPLVLSLLAIGCTSGTPDVGKEDPFGMGGAGTGGSTHHVVQGGAGGEQVIVVGGNAGTETMAGAGGKENACATSSQEVKLIPLDLGLLVDTSISMDYEDKWIKVKGALSIVSESSRYANIGMALQFFPLRLACEESAYAAPVVSMATLPAVGESLRTALSNQRMSGGTPLVQALRGMGKYVTTWATAHPDHRTVLVVATDGIPDTTCSSNAPPNTLENAVTIAGQLALGTFEGTSPKVPVFVIGVGDKLEALNEIALAGGSKAATLVSAGADVEAQFIAALDAIRAQTMTCDYAIPKNPTGNIDYNAVNVAFTQGNVATTLLYVPKAEDCKSAPGKGWYFDDPKNPTKVTLCPDICETVSTATKGAVSVVFGCKREDAPIIQ